MTGSANISSEHLNHSRTHDVPVDCTWIIRAEEGKHIYLQFPEYDLQMPNDCNYNFIQIFDGKTDIEHRKRNLCGSVAHCDRRQVAMQRSLVSGSGIIFGPFDSLK